MNEPRSAFVYRCFDSSGDLLYVGMTYNTDARIARHRSASPWWPDVNRVTRDIFDSRGLASIAELTAIRTEHPRHNIQGVVTMTAEMAARLESAAHDYEQAIKERNQAIVAAYHDGETLREIAEQVGMSFSGVRNIINQDKGATP